MKKEDFPKPHQVLLKAWNRKQKAQPGYSQRALARDLGVSSVFVTKLFTGMRPLPLSRIKKVCDLLDMDFSAQSALLRSIVMHSLPSKELREAAFALMQTAPKKIEREAMAKPRYRVLDHWYNVAVLDLLTLENFHATPANIAKRLGISVAEVNEALESLSREELIAKDAEGQWRKSVEHTYFPTTATQAEVRRFHRQMIRKAYDELTKVRSEDFERRLITGFTIAANPDRIEELKGKIHDFLQESSDHLTKGSCEEVYQLNVQFFPLTRKAE